MNLATYHLDEEQIMLLHFFDCTTVLILFTIAFLLTCKAFRRAGHRKCRKAHKNRWPCIKLLLLRFLFLIYIYIILAGTLLGRTVCIIDPLCLLWQGWILTDSDMTFNPLTNISMFIPYTFLLFSAIPHVGHKKRWICLLISLGISFASSLFVESMQLITHLGTFEISDLTYNTLGGGLGCLVFMCCRTYKGK